MHYALGRFYAMAGYSFGRLTLDVITASQRKVLGRYPHSYGCGLLLCFLRDIGLTVESLKTMCFNETGRGEVKYGI